MTTTYYAAAYSGDTRIPGQDCDHQHVTISGAIECCRRQPLAWFYCVRAMEDGEDRRVSAAEYDDLYDAQIGGAR